MISYNNSAPNAVNNVGHFGATEGSIGAYKSAAEYAADSKYWAMLSQKNYNSIDGILKEVESLYAEGSLLKEDIEQLKYDFENQNQTLLGLIQQTGEAIDNTNIAIGEANAATDQANQAVQDVLTQLDKISNMSVVATTLPPGAPATGSFDNSTGVFSFGIPEGQPGKDGKDGTDGTVSDIADVAVSSPVADDYGFFVDKDNGGLYRTPMSEIAKLVPAVASFNGRTGPVVPAAGDYTVNQVTGAAASGVNSDINQILGLTTALSVAQGGTGAKDAAGARTNLGLGPISTLSTVPIANGGTGATTADAARISLVAAKSGANSDITSMANKVTFTQSPVVPDAVDDSDAVTLRQLRNSSDSDGILANKQAVARHFGVKQSEVVYFSVGAVLSGYKVIYDKVSQRAYSLPADIGSGVTAVSLSTAGVLVHSAGSVDLGALAVAREEYVTLPGSFSTGVTINAKNELVVFTDGKYRWDGALPKEVPAGTDPTLPGSGYIRYSNQFTSTQARESLRRSYAEAGYNLVDGSFEAGGTLVNANDVLLQESTGKAFTGTAGTVAAGTNPASVGFVDVSGRKTDRLTSVSSLGIIGDGVTDWSAAIQYAVDTYGSLYFPEGTYICANVLLRTGVQLVAASWATVLKLPDGATTRSINGSLPDSRGRYPANVITTVLNHNGGAYFDNGARAKMLNNSFYIVDGAEVSGFTIDGNKAGNPVGDVGENASAMGAGVCVFLSRGVKVKNNRIINCRQDGVILGYTLCGGSDECDVSDNVFFGNQRTNIALITGQRNKITGNLGGPTTGGINTIKGAAVDLEPNWADEVCANNILTDNIMLGQVSLVCANPAYMRNNKFHGNLWIGTAWVNSSSDTQGSVFDADTFIADTTQPTPGPWISKAGPFNPSSASIKTTPPVRFSNCTAIGFDTLLQNLTQGQHENLIVENSTIRVKTIGQVVRGYRVDIKNNDITMDGDATSEQSILWSNSLGAIVPHQGCNSFKGNSVRGVSQSRLLEVINDKSYTNSRKTVEIHNNDFDVTGHTAIGAVTGDFDFTENTITDWKPIDISNVVKPFSIKGNTLSANASTDMFVNQAGYINDISVSGNELTNININVQRPSGVTVNSNEMVDCSISVLYSFTASGVGGNSFSFNRMKNRSKTLVPITATLEGSSTTEDFWFKDIYKGNVISGYASEISIADDLTSVSEVS